MNPVPNGVEVVVVDRASINDLPGCPRRSAVPVVPRRGGGRLEERHQELDARLSPPLPFDLGPDRLDGPVQGGSTRRPLPSFDNAFVPIHASKRKAPRLQRFKCGLKNLIVRTLKISFYGPGVEERQASRRGDCDKDERHTATNRHGKRCGNRYVEDNSEVRRLSRSFRPKGHTLPPVRHLRRKLTLRAHGEQVVFVKRAQERIEHVWMKAFLWALYLPDYPDLSVEVEVGDKYKPDVVDMDLRRGRPRFWGEAGHVGPEKIESLVDRYPRTHLAIAKWDRSLDAVRETVETAVHDVDRAAPVDLVRVPDDSAERVVDEKGRISIAWDDVSWTRMDDAAAWR